MDVVEEMTGARSRCEAASSAASEMEIALAFLLRVLKANFLGGLKVARMVCSFSDRALTACAVGVSTFSEVLVWRNEIGVLPRCRFAGRMLGCSSKRL